MDYWVFFAGTTTISLISLLTFYKVMKNCTLSRNDQRYPLNALNDSKKRARSSKIPRKIAAMGRHGDDLRSDVGSEIDVNLSVWSAAWSHYSGSHGNADNRRNNVSVKHSKGNQESMSSMSAVMLHSEMLSSSYTSHSFTQIRHSSSDSSLNRNAIDNIQKKGKTFDVSKGHSGGIRTWHYTPLGSKLKKFDNFGRQQGVVFKVMSYNCLAQELLEFHPDLYREHNQKALNWQCRIENLMKEIKDHKADILCLQEVQQSHLEEFYIANLEQLGYKGFFKKRTGNFPDGCALFYKPEIFKIDEHQFIEFMQPSSPFTNRNNVGIIARFSPKKHPKHSFVVATTHLLYNPKREDVRLAQMQILLTELDRFAFSKENGNDYYVPVIICGDFNSEVSGDLNAFLSNGQISYSKHIGYGEKSSWLPYNLGVTNLCQHLALLQVRQNDRKVSRDNERDLIQIRMPDKEEFGMNLYKDPQLFDSGSLKHSFKLSSVYPLNTNEVSTKQDDWKLVDYIYFSKCDGDRKLKLLSKYRLPTSQQMGSENIPNSSVGSDHFSLIALFKFEF